MSWHSIQHKILNGLYWAENPEFNPISKDSKNPIKNLGLYAIEAFRGLNLNLTTKFTNLLMVDPESVIGIGGESIAIVSDDGKTVSKYMFRMSGDPEIMVESVRRHYEMIKQNLGQVAIDTDILVEKIKVFKLGRPVDVVVQRQAYLSPERYTELFSSEIYRSEKLPDTTRKDLETIVDAWKDMKAETGMHPDISVSADNLFVDSDGFVKLVDVMPIPVSGRRLVGDRPVRSSQARTIKEIESRLIY